MGRRQMKGALLGTAAALGACAALVLPVQASTVSHPQTAAVLKEAYRLQEKGVGLPHLHNQERIEGYYPDWAIYTATPYYAADIPTNEVNVVNYAFANIVNGQIAVGDPWSDLQKPVPGDNPNDPFQGNFDALVNMKKQDPNLITMISVGGWTWSSGFSAVAATQQSRDLFADSVVQFLREYGFDGVDLDRGIPCRED